MKIYDAMIAGHLCIDIIPRFESTGAGSIGEIMSPGKLVNVLEAMISTGGPVSNTGINMKTLGNNVCFCACVGNDVLGKLTIDILQNSGSSSGIHVKEGYSSSYTIVVAPPGIDRVFLHNPGTNDLFTNKHLNPDLISQCRHFHFGYPPLMKNVYKNQGEELVSIFKIAKSSGATTSCDMTLPDPASPSGKIPWRKVLLKILPYVDFFLPSVEETLYMLDPDRFLKMKHEQKNLELIDYLTAEDYSKLADELLKMGCKVVTLKSGHRGFYVKTGSKDIFSDSGSENLNENWLKRQLWAPAFEVSNFGSATGSGDSSIAGFLSAYLRGLTIEKSLKYATCCGWQNVQVLDAVSGIKSWQETTEFIQQDMPLIDIKMNDSRWKWAEKYQLWSGPEDPLN